MGVSPLTITPGEQGKKVHFLTILIQHRIKNSTKYKKARKEINGVLIGKVEIKRSNVQTTEWPDIENSKESTSKSPRTIRIYILNS